MAGPQTAREALIAELLGDVGALLDRLDMVKAGVPVAVDDALSRIMLAGEGAASRIEDQSAQMTRAIEAERELLSVSLRATAKAGADIALAAQQVADSVSSAKRTSMLIGLAAGCLAGLIGGAAAAAMILA